MIIAGSIAPDLFTGLNWAHRLATGKGSFWKTKKDFVGLVLGKEEYAWGGAEVNKGLLFKCQLFADSIFFILIVLLILPREFALAYGLHIMIDAFTHKNAEQWSPLYPLSKVKLRISISRWRLELVWYVILNFIILGVLYWLKFR